MSKGEETADSYLASLPKDEKVELMDKLFKEVLRQWEAGEPLGFGIKRDLDGYTSKEIPSDWRCTGTIANLTYKLMEFPNNVSMEAMEIIYNCMEGLHSLYSKCRIVHGDVSPSNIQWYCNRQDEVVGVLIDFDYYTLEEIEFLHQRRERGKRKEEATEERAQ